MGTSDSEQGQRRQVPLGDSRTRYPSRVADLDFSTSQDGCVVSRPGLDRIHFLNPTAVLILEFANGKNSPEQIARLVQEAYALPEAPVADVQAALQQLKVEGLLL